MAKRESVMAKAFRLQVASNLAHREADNALCRASLVFWRRGKNGECVSKEVLAEIKPMSPCNWSSRDCKDGRMWRLETHGQYMTTEELARLAKELTRITKDRR